MIGRHRNVPPIRNAADRRGPATYELYDLSKTWPSELDHGTLFSTLNAETRQSPQRPTGANFHQPSGSSHRPPRHVAAFDLCGRDTDPVAFFEDLIRGARLSIDADEVVGRLAADLIEEQIFDSRVVFDFDIVGEPSAVIIYE